MRAILSAHDAGAGAPDHDAHTRFRDDMRTGVPTIAGDLGLDTLENANPSRWRVPEDTPGSLTLPWVAATTIARWQRMGSIGNFTVPVC